MVRVAVRRGIRVVSIMEWFWRRQHQGRQIMREVVRFARSVGAPVIAAVAMPGTVHRRQLWRLGFVGVPHVFWRNVITLTVGPQGKSADRDRWFVPSNWYLTFGDGDIL